MYYLYYLLLSKLRYTKFINGSNVPLLMYFILLSNKYSLLSSVCFVVLLDSLVQNDFG